jgi:hypothetical protein
MKTSRLAQAVTSHSLIIVREFDLMQEISTSGQSHLISGTGSARCVITSELSKLCCIKVLYMALENLEEPPSFHPWDVVSMFFFLSHGRSSFASPSMLREKLWKEIGER